MLRSIFFMMLLGISINANAVVIDLDFNSTSTISGVLVEDSGVIIEDLGFSAIVLPPTIVSTGILLYDSGVKISMIDGSFFDLLTVGWSNWAKTKDSGVVYNDSNGITLPSDLSNGLKLDQTFFRNFGQNVDWVSFTSYKSGTKTLDYFEVKSATVPEPSILALLGFGLFGMLSLSRKRDKVV